MAYNFLTQAAGDARYAQIGQSFGDTGDLVSSHPNDDPDSGVVGAFSRVDHRHEREVTYGTAAERAALTGDDLFEGLRFRETDGSDKLFEYRAAAWLQVRDNLLVADAAARTAITTPYEGMEVREADTDRVYVYSGAAWIYVYGGTQPLYSARAYRNAALSFPASPSTTLIVYDTESWDYNSNFDVSTGRYTVPVTGLYLVNAQLILSMANNPESMSLVCYVNGSARSEGGFFTVRGATGGDAWSVQLNDILAVSAGDLIDIRGAHAAGGNPLPISTAAAVRNYVSIIKV